MFFLSKVIALATQPLVWVMAILFIGLMRPARSKWRWMLGALIALTVMAWRPLPDYLVRALESQYPEIAPSADVGHYTGIVVLGGATEDGLVAQAHSQPLLNSGAERMTAAATLLLKYPRLQMIYSGGEGQLLGQGPSEAQRAKMFFDSLGIAGDRVHYEAESRNTYENAVLSAQLLGVDKTAPWLLITSAWHMPRSQAVFAKTGWNTTPYPVDFRTGADTPWWSFGITDGAVRWELALHELVGLLLYRVTGRL